MDHNQPPKTAAPKKTTATIKPMPTLDSNGLFLEGLLEDLGAAVSLLMA